MFSSCKCSYKQQVETERKKKRRNKYDNKIEEDRNPDNKQIRFQPGNAEITLNQIPAGKIN